MSRERRPVDLVVLSDIHLGTAACRAEELLDYLRSIEPRQLILLGDIIDLWGFDRSAWTETHTKVLRRLLKFAQRGVPVHYVIGNHDEALTAYAPFNLGTITLCRQLELELAGVRTWFIHGDVVDGLVDTPRWLAWLGTRSYDTLVTLNTLANRVRTGLGWPKASFAAMVKQRVGQANAHVRRYEELCARLAGERGCAAVVCGHIHVPAIRRITTDGHTVDYHNSGDWTDTGSALEFHDDVWRSVRHGDLAAQGLLPIHEHADEEEMALAV